MKDLDEGRNILVVSQSVDDLKNFRDSLLEFVEGVTYNHAKRKASACNWNMSFHIILDVADWKQRSAGYAWDALYVMPGTPSEVVEAVMPRLRSQTFHPIIRFIGYTIEDVE